MTFPKVKFSFSKYSIVLILCSAFASCQEPEKEKQLAKAPLQQENSPQIATPAWFTADSARQLESRLDSIFSHLHTKKGFNGTVLVTKYNQVIYKGAFGFSDFQKKDTLTTQTAFQLASVSKQFTAMAIMMLQEQGKLSYEDSVQHYIPSFPYKGITIRQLLTHRSGLPNYTYFSDKLWPDRNVPITNDDVLKLMAAHQPDIYYKPDTHFDYSNTGYALLASIVTRASGMPFAAFLQKYIFSPLEMTHTFTFSEDMAVLTGEIATGHTGARRKRTPDYLDTVLGDKGIYSTVEDLYKWDQALYTQKLVKQETLEEAFTGTRPESKKSEDYGFGWRIRQAGNKDTIVYHAGLWHGYTSYMLRNPKDYSALIVLSNLPNGSLRHLKEIQQFLYPPHKAGAGNKKQPEIASTR